MGPATGSSRYSSTTAWTLTPPSPKALTPARSGASAPSAVRTGSQGSRSRTTRSGLFSSRRCGLRVSRCTLPGISRWRIESSALIRPVTPAAASRWPVLGFADPSATCGTVHWAPWSAYSRVKAVFRPSTSIGSPSSVPVPCVST